MFFVAVGVVIGFVAAQRVSRTPSAAHLLAQVDAGAKAFRGAVVDGYRSRGAELRPNGQTPT
nr:hypothetical protein [Curtobacterium sp. WW7]